MSGDDGRYGWVDYQGTDPPAVIVISLRGPAFHKTCAAIVDEMLG
jgi:hypothetical protein